MPDVTIGGKALPRVHSVDIHITHGDSQEARQMPRIEAVVKGPADNDVTLAQWALNPQGDPRYAKVEIKTYDRSKKLNKTWTILKAYLHDFTENEYPEGSGDADYQGNYYVAVIRGTLIHATETYNGKNIMEVSAGEAEANPS